MQLIENLKLPYVALICGFPCTCVGWCCYSRCWMLCLSTLMCNKLLQKLRASCHAIFIVASLEEILCICPHTHIHAHILWHVNKILWLLFICIFLMPIFLQYFKFINSYNLYFIIKFWVASYWSNPPWNRSERKKRKYTIFFTGNDTN